MNRTLRRTARLAPVLFWLLIPLLAAAIFGRVEP
jgi:hypothetical protein